MSAPGETDRPFAGRVAFITGAAHGQGRAVALALAESGADIVAFDVAAKIEYPAYAQGSSAELDSLVAEVHALGRRALAFVGDVRDSAAIQQAVDAAVAEFGRIDVLFNNAGIVAYAAADEMTELEWDAMIDVNLKGPFLVARSVIPVMKAQRSGVIINIASIAGVAPVGLEAMYSASKAGMIGLTQALARDWGEFGIRVHAVAPGYVESEMNRPIRETASRLRENGTSPVNAEEAFARDLVAGITARTPLGRFGLPEEIAEVVAFLASDRARYMTGAVTMVDGGWTIGDSARISAPGN